MGIRGEIFSRKVQLQNRTYFFNVKENRRGDLYLNIVESKNQESGGFERQSIVLFADDLRDFLKGFDDSLLVLEKAVRESRRSLAKNPVKQFEKHAPELSSKKTGKLSVKKIKVSGKVSGVEKKTARVYKAVD
jgi:hypothetical protein